MNRAAHLLSTDGNSGRRGRVRSTGRGAETRTRILDAAEQLFAQMGFAATRVDDIAAAVGIRKPSVLHYFDSKQQIYGEVEERIHDGLLESVLERELSGLAPVDGVMTIADACLDYLAASPASARILLRSIADGYSQADYANKSAQRLLALWTESLAGDAEDGRTSQIEPMALLAAVGGAALTFIALHPTLQAVSERGDEGMIERFRNILHLSLAANLKG